MVSDAHNIFIKPAPGERIETTLVLEPAESASLCGLTLRADGTPVGGVLALLYADDGATPIDQAVSDEAGRFCFGPLEADRLYTIHLHERHRAIRVLEVAL